MGEIDHENETEGVFPCSKSTDRQGLHKLAQGQYFFEQVRHTAEKLDIVYHWQMEVVPDVGHDYELMGNAAAKYLYGDTQ